MPPGYTIPNSNTIINVGVEKAGDCLLVDMTIQQQPDGLVPLKIF